MVKKFNLLVIGVGSIGSRHAKLLCDRSNVNLFLYDIDKKKASAMCNELGATFFQYEEGSLEKMDILWICTSANHHYAYCMDGLQGDCHIFVEKPISNKLEEVLTLEHSLLSDRVFMVGYNWRFHPATKLLSNIISDDSLGDPIFARFECASYLPEWHSQSDYTKEYSASKKMGGGVLLDISHEIDLGLYLFGEPKADSIKCRYDKLSDLKIKTEDVAELWWKSKDNVWVSVFLNYFARTQHRRIYVNFQKGDFVWDLISKKISIFNVENNTQESYDVDYEAAYSTYIEEHDKFFEEIARGAQSYCKFEDAKAVLQLVTEAKGE